jgi:hypothetical protein
MKKIEFINKAKSIAGLCFMLLFLSKGMAQMSHYDAVKDEWVNGVLELEDNKILLFGFFDESDQEYNPIALFYELELSTNKLTSITVNFSEYVRRCTRAFLINDTIYCFGSYMPLGATTSKPCFFTLNKSYELLHFQELIIRASGDAGVETALVKNDNLVVVVSDYIGATMQGSHVLEINKQGSVIQSTHIENTDNSFKYCTSICLNDNNNSMLLSFANSLEGEELYTIDAAFNITFIKHLPAKPNAQQTSDGYLFRYSVGSIFLNNKYYLSIRHSHTYYKAPSFKNEQFMGVMSLNENFDTLNVSRVGPKNKTSTLTAFNYSNNAFYLMGTNAIYGTNYPPKGSPSGIMYAKLDTLGNILWEGTYTDSSFYRNNKMIGLPDGGCLIVGSRYLEGETEYMDPFVMRVNNAGEVTSIAILEKPEIGIYPNPTKDGKITVQFTPEQAVNTWQFSIVNLQGQVLQQGSLTPYENQLTLNENLPTGNYIITFYGNNMAPVSKRITKL